VLATFLGLHWDGYITFGDAVVGVGTLGLALFTWRLAGATKKSIKAGEKSAGAAEKSAASSDAAVKAAIENIEIDKQGVDAMKAQVEAMSVPYVVPIRDPNYVTEPSGDKLPMWRPIHRALVDGRRVVRLRLLNIGSGPAIVTGVQFTAVKTGVDLLAAHGRAYPLAGSEAAEDVELPTGPTWPSNPSDLTYAIDYKAVDGRQFRTVGDALLHRAGEEIECLSFTRVP
jgi:hypothetical protein